MVAIFGYFGGEYIALRAFLYFNFKFNLCLSIIYLFKNKNKDDMHVLRIYMMYSIVYNHACSQIVG